MHITYYRVVHKCKQRDFLAMARILIIDSEKLDQPITVETLFCLMPCLKICLILTYWLCFSTRVHKKLLRYAKCNFNGDITKDAKVVCFCYIANIK